MARSKASLVRSHDFLKRLHEGVLFLLFLEPTPGITHCLKKNIQKGLLIDLLIDLLTARRPRFLFNPISQAKSLRKFVWSSLGIVCNEWALGMEHKSIPNSAISASSFEADRPPSSGRIYNSGGWRALSNDTSPYLEVSKYNNTFIYCIGWTERVPFRAYLQNINILVCFGAYYSIRRKSISFFWTIRYVCFESCPLRSEFSVANSLGPNISILCTNMQMIVSLLNAVRISSKFQASSFKRRSWLL